MSTLLKKYLQIYELFAQDPTVSKEFSYAGKPQVVSSYSFKSMAVTNRTNKINKADWLGP